MLKKTTTWIKENKETVLMVTLVTICGAAMVYAGHQQAKTLSKSVALVDDDLCLLYASRQAMEDLVSGERMKYPILDESTNRAFELTYFGPLSTYEV